MPPCLWERMVPVVSLPAGWLTSTAHSSTFQAWVFPLASWTSSSSLNTSMIISPASPSHIKLIAQYFLDNFVVLPGTSQHTVPPVLFLQLSSPFCISVFFLILQNSLLTCVFSADFSFKHSFGWKKGITIPICSLEIRKGEHNLHLCTYLMSLLGCLSSLCVLSPRPQGHPSQARLWAPLWKNHVFILFSKHYHHHFFQKALLVLVIMTLKEKILFDITWTLGAKSQKKNKHSWTSILNLPYWILHFGLSIAMHDNDIWNIRGKVWKQFLLKHIWKEDVRDKILAVHISFCTCLLG